MSSTLRGPVTHGVESVDMSEEPLPASTLSSIVEVVRAVVGVVAVLRRLDRQLGIARRIRAAPMLSAGLALGAGLAVLFAPMPGADLRRKLLRRLDAASA